MVASDVKITQNFLSLCLCTATGLDKKRMDKTILTKNGLLSENYIHIGRNSPLRRFLEEFNIELVLLQIFHFGIKEKKVLR